MLNPTPYAQRSVYFDISRQFFKRFLSHIHFVVCYTVHNWFFFWSAQSPTVCHLLERIYTRSFEMIPTEHYSPQFAS